MLPVASRSHFDLSNAADLRNLVQDHLSDYSPVAHLKRCKTVKRNLCSVHRVHRVHHVHLCSKGRVRFASWPRLRRAAAPGGPLEDPRQGLVAWYLRAGLWSCEAFILCQFYAILVKPNHRLHQISRVHFTMFTFLVFSHLRSIVLHYLHCIHCTANITPSGRWLF